jgi:hypothetical protein
MVAVDACGNSSNTVSQTITQVDSQAPVIGAAGANATIECTATRYLQRQRQRTLVTRLL